MHKEKFMIYRRDAKKGEATYSPKSHSAPHFEGQRSGSLYLTMSSSNESSPLLQLHIMALP